MSNCAIVGINWGDEGKGRMVDLIASDYDIVCRYQGGNNAGHTIVNEYGKFALHLIPSGICLPGVVNVLGNGVVIDLESLCGEIETLQKAGVSVTPENFKISERATIVFPYHRALDGLEEARLKDKKYGSTLRGIAPVYSDKYQKKTIMMGELLYPKYLEKRLASILEWKNLTIQNVYGAEAYKLEDMLAWCQEFGSKLAPYICDTSKYLYEAEKAGKNIMFEAQLGALRDIDYGIYPYTSSSNTIGAYAPIGAGIPGRKLDLSIGIMKAYSSCVGDGPFTAELAMTEPEKDVLREHGHEYGAATGRPRRVGPFDAVASRYGVRCQGADELALTLLDVLDYMEEVPVVTHYRLTDGTVTDRFPMGKTLDDAQPVVEKLPGWHTDISGIRRFEDLPAEAQNYVLTLEKLVGCPIKYISVGPERDAYIER